VGIESGNFQIPNNGHVEKETVDRVDSLINTAKKDALSRVGNLEAQQRAVNGIERTLRPYILENEVIAAQLITPEYEHHVKETDKFLDIRIASVACADGRIIHMQLASPRTMSMSRRLGGIPETRQSTRNKNEHILNDPDLQASIAIDINKRKKNSDKTPEIAEFVGPHIFSENPEEGCVYLKGRALAAGRATEIAMRHGALDEYYSILGDGIQAFDNMTRTMGGKSTTFDLTHDAYTQGIIVGLREQITNFDPQLLLRGNLMELHRQHKILVSQLLDNSFKGTIIDMARSVGVNSPLDVVDYKHVGRNSIIIGKIARDIAAQEEEAGFGWIPDCVKDAKSERSIRALGYVSLWNIVYRTLGDIKPGQHMLQEHPERLARIGPIGADFNIENIPFIMHAPPGPLSEKELEGVARIHGLSHDVAVRQGVDLMSQGRVILVTGKFDEKRYANPEIAEEERESVNSVVGNNAAIIREKFIRSVENGETVVVGSLLEPSTRKVTHIVK
jgi:hypothetical protein